MEAFGFRPQIFPVDAPIFVIILHPGIVEPALRGQIFSKDRAALFNGLDRIIQCRPGVRFEAPHSSDIEVDRSEVPLGETVTVQAVLRNTGAVEAEEVVQLYVRDLVGSVTRPVKELKGFQRVRLKPGEHRTVSFTLGPEDLAFYGRDMKPVTEPGEFQVWIGGSSKAALQSGFRLTAAQDNGTSPNDA